MTTPDPGKRLTFEQSMKLIEERWGAVLEYMATTHYCPDPENCSFGGQGCITEDVWSEPTSTPYEDIINARKLLEREAGFRHNEGEGGDGRPKPV